MSEHKNYWGAWIKRTTDTPKIETAEQSFVLLHPYFSRSERVNNLINNYRLSRQSKDRWRQYRTRLDPCGVLPPNEFITNFRDNPGAERTGNLERALVWIARISREYSAIWRGGFQGGGRGGWLRERRMGGEEKRRNCRATAPTDSRCGF